MGMTGICRDASQGRVDFPRRPFQHLSKYALQVQEQASHTIPPIVAPADVQNCGDVFFGWSSHGP